MFAGDAMGQLTTHVLDTAAGSPAAGVVIELFALSDGGENRLCRVETNNDGRCDGPVAAGDGFRAGVYELRFHVGDYFRARGQTLPSPAFLDVVPIRFGIASPGEHYHVPLLISPFAYSTYRGS